MVASLSAMGALFLSAYAFGLLVNVYNLSRWAYNPTLGKETSINSENNIAHKIETNNTDSQTYTIGSKINICPKHLFCVGV